MVKIRLARGGKTNDPFYRVVAVEKTRKREGKALEVLGWWHPREDEVKINKKAIEAWLKKGAQMTQGVKTLMT